MRYNAACSSAERIAFRQINKATGNRLRQQLIDEETREPVAPEHKGRGYEVAKGQYLIVEDAELEAIEIESTHTIEIDRFVPHSAIDRRFFDNPYYVMPSAPVGQQAFAVIREAMRGKGMVALGRLVLSKRGKWSDQLRRPDRSSLRANSDISFDADVSVYADEKACLEFMEKRRAVLIGVLGLAVGALSFWITLSLVDYGFWGVLHAVFP